MGASSDGRRVRRRFVRESQASGSRRVGVGRTLCRSAQRERGAEATRRTMNGGATISGNLVRRGRRSRTLLGLVAGALAIALLILLDRSGAPQSWRTLIFPLWWLMALGFMQARTKICVLLAARGTCERAD